MSLIFIFKAFTAFYTLGTLCTCMCKVYLLNTTAFLWVACRTTTTGWHISMHLYNFYPCFFFFLVPSFDALFLNAIIRTRFSLLSWNDHLFSASCCSLVCMWRSKLFVKSLVLALLLLLLQFKGSGDACSWIPFSTNFASSACKQGWRLTEYIFILADERRVKRRRCKRQEKRVRNLRITQSIDLGNEYTIEHEWQRHVF